VGGPTAHQTPIPHPNVEIVGILIFSKALNCFFIVPQSTQDQPDFLF
jgi:hypothetical protein